MKNREILFRGKDFQNKWVYGDLHHKRFTAFATHMIEDVNGMGSDVNSETVGQFTGLFDKKGVRIFDGDIVYFKRGIGNWTGKCITTKHIVSWDKTVSRFSLGTEAESLKFRSHPRYEYEVIGNIHDNPELL